MTKKYPAAKAASSKPKRKPHTLRMNAADSPLLNFMEGQMEKTVDTPPQKLYMVANRFVVSDHDTGNKYFAYSLSDALEHIRRHMNKTTNIHIWQQEVPDAGIFGY